MSPSSPLVQVTGLRVEYRGFVALQGVDLELHAGRITALLGTNGAGKSSLIRALVGLLPAASGAISFSADDPRRSVGYCPQDLVLWPELTVREQVAMFGELYGLDRNAARSRADVLIEELDLVDKRNARAGSLSGGMRRRLSIAMALVHSPTVVVFDEAEVGLDAQTRVMLRSYIERLARQRNIAILSASHDIAEVERLADEVVILDRGKCVAQGRPAELTKGRGSLEELFVQIVGAAT